MAQNSDPQAPVGRFSALSVIAFVLDFLFAPAGIICAHIALAQSSRNGGRGRGFSKSALIVGYTLLAIDIIGLIIRIIQ
jgi:hypothetical protein